MDTRGEKGIDDLDGIVLLIQNEEMTRANMHKFLLVVNASRLSKELGTINVATSTMIYKPRCCLYTMKNDIR